MDLIQLLDPPSRTLPTPDGCPCATLSAAKLSGTLTLHNGGKDMYVTIGKTVPVSWGLSGQRKPPEGWAASRPGGWSDGRMVGCVNIRI